MRNTRGAEGQLGHGDTVNLGDDELPVTAGAVDLGGAAVRVVAGGAHTCAQLVGGSVRCWGDGAHGQLGYGNTERVGDDETPAEAGPVPVGGPVAGLAAGREHTCALLETGAVRCWGRGDFGQLGYGDTKAIGDGEVPLDVGDLDLGGHVALAVFAGPLSRSTCVLLDEGSVRCWGDNQYGQLGYGHTEQLGDELGEHPGYLPDILIIHDDEA
ncbi:MAG: hypothetical protein KDK70_26560 [Myxococcales bacterium]|nr:hypothetical protein [Myxococcales bacterium]